MKKQILLCVLTLANIFAFVNFAQSQTNGQEKKISINDISKTKETSGEYPTVGRKVGDVVVDKRTEANVAYDNYTLHFFKMFENKLRNYEAEYNGNEKFTNASYKWLDDTIVAITLVNPTTNKTRTIKLVQTFKKGTSAGMIVNESEVDNVAH